MGTLQKFSRGTDGATFGGTKGLRQSRLRFTRKLILLVAFGPLDNGSRITVKHDELSEEHFLQHEVAALASHVNVIA